jgi:hypothetical protein
MAILSSGTYTYVVINSSSGACGTCTSTAQPHPVWSSNTNSADTIVQLNAVTLGGFNGLNN